MEQVIHLREKGQVTVPLALLKAVDAVPGDVFKAHIEGDPSQGRIVLELQRVQKVNFSDALVPLIEHDLRRQGLSEEQIKASLPKVKAEMEQKLAEYLHSLPRVDFVDATEWLKEK